jgi:hypothetical protein
VQRSPFDHPAGKQPRFGVTIGPLDGGHDKVDGGFDDLGDRLADRGQVDVLPARHLHVVQPDQANIAGAPSARVLNRAERPDGQDVIAAEIGLGRVRHQELQVISTLPASKE